MTIYVEAFYADGTQKLGNIDGQTAYVGVCDYKRTNHYKRLKSGTMAALPSVAYWRIVDENGNVLETIQRKR